MSNILLISDNQSFATDLKEQLELYATDFKVFEQWDDGVIFDVAIVDDSLDVVSDLHQKLRQSPIIYLGSDGSNLPESVTVILKPFRLEDFLDSVLSCINLFVYSHDGRLKFGNYVLDSAKKEIKSLQTREVTKLTEREIMILNYMYKAYPKVVSKTELLSEVWGYNPDATTHTVETHIYRLRQKVEGQTQDAIILTEESGYNLNF